MQDLASLEKAITGMAKAFETGGLVLLVAILAVIGYLIFTTWIKSSKAALKGINVQVGANGSAAGKECPVHSDLASRTTKLETKATSFEETITLMRRENREDHERIFTELKELAVAQAKR